MNWKVGDRARVNCPQDPMHGTECVVIELNVDTWCFITNRKIIAIGTNLTDNGWKCAYEPHELIPIDKEKGSWEAIKDIWNPLEKV